MDKLVLVALAISLVANVCLAYRAFSKKKTLALDARQLLHDLTSGRAVVDVRVIDTAGVFLRSPRG
jgi:hypothetical protein